jgi:hypothetical protein
LKINLQALEEDNQSLSKKLKIIKHDYLHLANEYKKVSREDHEIPPMDEIYNELINTDYLEEVDDQNNFPVFKNKSDEITEDNIDNLPSNKFSVDLHSNYNTKTNFRQIDSNFNSKTDLFKRKLFDEEIEDYKNYPNALITSLQENIKEIKSEYNSVHSNYIDEIKQRNEAQQLIQKCIEDLKIEISKVSKELSYHAKNHGTNFRGPLQKYDEQMLAKKNHQRNLEHKLKIMTFIYDNGFQNTKMRKNKLFAQTGQNFYDTKY